MSNVILVIFEGERAETQIFTNLENHYFNTETSIIRATFAADIYQFWTKVKDNEFLDILELLRERTSTNKEALKGITREDISEIFLFFDYDGHASTASDDELSQMLSFFDNETESGKLYVSYPMVEAIKHFEESVLFKDTHVPAKENIEYKELINSVSIYQNLKNLTFENWKHINLENFKKAHYLVNNSSELLSYSEARGLNQTVIFSQQLVKFIVPRAKITVLSAFPFFIVEYFGEGIFNEFVNHLNSQAEKAIN